MDLVNQPSLAPTRKLTYALFGQIIGAVVYAIFASYWPAIAQIQIEGYGSMSVVFQLLGAASFGYAVRDRMNV